MIHLQVTTPGTDKLNDLFASDEGVAALAEEILNKVLEVQMTEHLQAKPYERTDRRRAYRNGYKPRKLTASLNARADPVAITTGEDAIGVPVEARVPVQVLELNEARPHPRSRPERDAHR